LAYRRSYFNRALFGLISFSYLSTAMLEDQKCSRQESGFLKNARIDNLTQFALSYRRLSAIALFQAVNDHLSPSEHDILFNCLETSVAIHRVSRLFFTILSKEILSIAQP